MPATIPLGAQPPDANNCVPHARWYLRGRPMFAKLNSRLACFVLVFGWVCVRSVIGERGMQEGVGARGMGGGCVVMSVMNGHVRD